MKYSYQKASLVILLLVVAACKEQENYPESQRDRLIAAEHLFGLPLLSDFNLDTKLGRILHKKPYDGIDYEIWYPRIGNNHDASYLYRKVIYSKNGVIIGEDNEWCGKDTIQYFDGAMREGLSLKCRFDSLTVLSSLTGRYDSLTALSATATLRSTHAESVPISLETADSILKAWDQPTRLVIPR